MSSQTKRHRLTEHEINEFTNYVSGGQTNNYISRIDLDRSLEQAYDDLAQQFGSPYAIKRDQAIDSCQKFSKRIIGSSQEQIPRSEFIAHVRECDIPSLWDAKEHSGQRRKYFASRHRWRKIRAYWAVHGPEVIFTCLVVSTQIAFGAWQLITFDKGRYSAAFGPGVIVAKACSGALYPTFFFLLLSVSRYFSTLLRRSYFLSRLLNVDLSRAFHIHISIVAFILCMIHAVSHLAGTFVHGSRPAVREDVIKVIGSQKLGQLRYVDYICSVPSLTGIVAFGLFCVIAALSAPQIRRRYYNLFQLGHLLIYPIIGLLFAHGTSSLLQGPIFGYFLAFPVLLVFFERVSRMISSFYGIKAKLKILDEDTVEITAVVPKYRGWDYTAGQYIFLQVPQISFFQWHPFTISYCRAKTLSLHIKTSGDWTAKLRQLPEDILIGINGPFGAPAQRFYDFKYSLIIGTGIGITPFSAIVADLQFQNDSKYGGPCQHDSGSISDMNTHDAIQNDKPNQSAKDFRRTDFHWIVRDGNSLMWLSDLLNRVSVSQRWHRENDERSHLDIRLNTHITSSRSHIATHVLTWLLETSRTEEYPTSLLTGLLNPTNCGRPDFDQILNDHYDEMRAAKQNIEESNTPDRGYDTVGVFYCGAAAVGEILADKCEELSIRGREDGIRIQYRFMQEVFG